jgi:two-component system, OmpR family, response regulator
MLKIVFCEDEGRIRKLIHAMLNAHPYKIYTAVDGIEGLEMIERERPDLIFADISMPGYDGFQLADIVKSRPHLAHIPFIFLTAFAQKSEKDEGRMHGACAYLTKPFTTEDLVTKIEQFLPQRAQVEQKARSSETL